MERLLLILSSACSSSGTAGYRPLECVFRLIYVCACKLSLFSFHGKEQLHTITPCLAFVSLSLRKQFTRMHLCLSCVFKVCAAVFRALDVTVCVTSPSGQAGCLQSLKAEKRVVNLLICAHTHTGKSVPAYFSSLVIVRILSCCLEM